MDGCALADDGARAERSYEHLRYQRALLAWLADQGLRATMEKVLGADSRADLHVVVDGRSQTLDVQLSPIAGKVWRDRDEKYRSHVDHVAWLYARGPRPRRPPSKPPRDTPCILEPPQRRARRAARLGQPSRPPMLRRSSRSAS